MQAPTTMMRNRSFSPSFPLAFARSCAVAAVRRAPFCKIADLKLERITHAVQRGGHEIALSPKEYALLEFLMRNAGQPVSRAAILEQAWKFDLDTMTNVVDVHINYLRRKVDLGYDRAHIRTIRRVGYQIGENTKLG
jgi:two-component system OmpR family response regulator